MKIKRIYTLAIMSLMILGCGLLTSCGSKSVLEGKWEAVDNEGETFVFNSDGTYMYSCPMGNDASGTYKVSESEVQLTSGASGLGADLNKVSGLHEFKIDRDILQFDSFGLASTKYKKIK